MARAFVLRPGDGRSVDLGGLRMSALALAVIVLAGLGPRISVLNFVGA